MTDLNQIIIGGRVTADLTEKNVTRTASGMLKISFSLASNKSRKMNDGSYSDETTFVDCEAWGKFAEYLQTRLCKGVKIVAVGRLGQSRWQDQSGQKRSRMFITIDTCDIFGGQPSLSPLNIPQNIPQNVLTVANAMQTQSVQVQPQQAQPQQYQPQPQFNGQDFPEDIPWN